MFDLVWWATHWLNSKVWSHSGLKFWLAPSLAMFGWREKNILWAEARKEWQLQKVSIAIRKHQVLMCYFLENCENVNWNSSYDRFKKTVKSTCTWRSSNISNRQWANSASDVFSWSQCIEIPINVTSATLVWSTQMADIFVVKTVMRSIWFKRRYSKVMSSGRNLWNWQYFPLWTHLSNYVITAKNKSHLLFEIKDNLTGHYTVIS